MAFSLLIARPQAANCMLHVAMGMASFLAAQGIGRPVRNNSARRWHGLMLTIPSLLMLLQGLASSLPDGALLALLARQGPEGQMVCWGP